MQKCMGLIAIRNLDQKPNPHHQTWDTDPIYISHIGLDGLFYQYFSVVRVNAVESSNHHRINVPRLVEKNPRL